MDADTFRKYLEESQPAFDLWGKYVADRINESAIRKLGDDGAVACFKIVFPPRRKTIESALGKVGRKGL